jgi:hypothetical protein
MQKPPSCYQDWDATLKKLGVVFLIILVGFISANAQLLNQDKSSVLDWSITGSNKLLVENDTIEFKGIILDSSTREPVVYATIVVNGRRKVGTYSHVDGSFILKLSGKESLIDSVQVTVQFLCYENVNLVLYSNKEVEINLVLIEDCALGFPGGCQFFDAEEVKVKPKPFKGFGTKFLNKD